MVNMKIVADILNREVDELDMMYLHDDWGAFYDDPVRYIGTPVVQMVNQYLDELHTVNKQYTGAQSVMEDEIIEAIERGALM